MSSGSFAFTAAYSFAGNTAVYMPTGEEGECRFRDFEHECVKEACPGQVMGRAGLSHRTLMPADPGFPGIDPDPGLDRDPVPVPALEPFLLTLTLGLILFTASDDLSVPLAFHTDLKCCAIQSTLLRYGRLHSCCFHV